MDDFCNGSQFLDIDLLWNNSWPQFTSCFQNTVVILAPCGWLWVTSLFLLIYISHYVSVSRVRLSRLHIAKAVLATVLFVLSLVVAIKHVMNHNQLGESSAKADVVSPFIRAATMLYSIGLMHLRRRSGMSSSGVIFTFWMFEVLTGIIPFYSKIIQQAYETDAFEFVIFYIDYFILLVQFLLNFWAEDNDPVYIDKKPICPEVYASFPSFVAFFWVTPLMWLGWKKPLDEDDMWVLDRADRCDRVLPDFQKNWKKQLKNMDADKDKRTSSKAASTANKEITEKTPLLRDGKHGGRPTGPPPWAKDGKPTGPPPWAKDGKQNGPPPWAKDGKQNGPPPWAKDEKPTGSPPWAKDGKRNGPPPWAKDGKQRGPPPGAGMNGKPKGPWAKQAIDNLPSPKASLIIAILKTFWWDLLKAHFSKLCSDLLTFVTPLLLQTLIKFTESDGSNTFSEPSWHGYLYVVGIFVAQLVVSFLTNQLWYRCMRVGMHIRTALTAVIYRKALRLSNTSRNVSTVGEIVNLMAVDSQRFTNVSMYIWVLWSAPLRVAIALYFLYTVIGSPVFAGLAVVVLLIPLNAVVARYMRKFQFRMMRLKDQRIKLMNEILNGIKVLKLYAWEVPFQDKVQVIRKEEMENVKRIYFVRAFAMFSMTLSPYMITLASFAVYIFTSESHFLAADIAFTSINLFSTLRMSITMLPMVITMMAQAWVSVKRINRFLCLDDVDEENVHHNSDEGDSIVIKDGTFRWDEAIGDCLKDVNIRISAGKLVAIVGTVGCGKSSLLSAMLGDMEKRSGRVNVKGTVAYVPQEAWIQNATLQQNVLFGKRKIGSTYEKIIDACALRPDLAMLPGGDQTEIGEKGINLSGGQKQRVSLARAVYNDRDIYLLDDPLSAVDTHVGKHIFEKVIGDTGMLKGKTRVLVTHGIHWLPMVDHIIVMSEGVVTETGSYDQLMTHDGTFAQFLNTYLTEHRRDIMDELDPDVKAIQGRMLQRVISIQSDSATSGDDTPRRKAKELSTSLLSALEDDKSLVSSSKLQNSSGTISKDLPGGPPGDTLRQRRHKAPRRDPLVGQTSIADLSESQEILDRNLQERDKSKEQDQTDNSRLTGEEETFKGGVSWKVYLVYIKSIGYAWCVSLLFSYIVAQAASMAASLWLQSWTDDPYISNATIPSNDTEKRHLNDVYLGVYGVWGVVQGIAIFVRSYIMAVGVTQGARRLHNSMLHSILRVPMSFFDTTPVGRILNRFSKDTDMVDENLPNMLNSLVMPLFSIIVAIIMVAINIPVFLAIVAPVAALYVFIQRFYVATSRQLRRVESKSRSPIFTHFTETLNGVSTIRAFEADERFIKINDDRVDFNQAYVLAGQAGSRWLGMVLQMIGDLCVLVAGVLAVNERGTITGGMMGLSLNYATQITGALNQFVSASSNVETDIVSVERLKEYCDLEPEADWFIPDKKPANSWPSTGEIDLSDYTTRYREGLDLVLRGITVNIKGGEKVGVVGRTGAGKSSLTLALFRLIEAAGGRITVDGVAISEIGLHDLRTKLTILPQDPILFSGTLRMNLDPFEEYADDNLWQVLEHAHLKPFVEGLPDGLDHECGEGGKNMSVGQRQLVCLARTLLRKTRILILDEATAAVDMETDELIQHTIREEFKDCTIISIAHRLNTIMDYDRIMVLDQGLVSEFDTPANLLQNKSGAFYAMANDASLAPQS